MAEFKDMLRFYRKKAHLSQAELARKLGLSPSAISMYEVGQRSPDFETEEAIADFFNTDLNTLRGKDVEHSHKPTVINVLGRVAAGIPIEAVEEVIDTEEITEEMASHGKYFGLLIKGDSMLPAICDQDVVIVRQQDDAESGDTVIALVNGDDATCKRLRKYKDGIELIPNNPSFSPMYFSNDDIQRKPVRIIGKVVELRRKF